MRRGWIQLLRWTGIGAAGVLCVLGLGLVSGYAYMQSEAGRARLVEFLNRQLSSPGGAQVRIGRLEGDLPGRIEIHDLIVADADGVWLRLKFAGASWQPSALLTGKLSVSQLDAEGLVIVRKPLAAQSSSDAGMPDVPLRVSIEHFSLRDAVLEQALLGEQVAFRASGDTAIQGPDEVVTRIEVTRTDSAAGQAQLEMLLRPQSEFLRIQLDVDEPGGGVLARALDLDGLPSLSIKLDGEGPLNAVGGSVRMSAGEMASIVGKYTVDATRGPALELVASADIARLLEPSLGKLLSGELALELQAALIDDGIHVRHASVENALARVELSGELRAWAADLEINASASDLAAFSDLAGTPLQGRGSIRSHVRSEDIRRVAIATTEARFHDVLRSANPLWPLLGAQTSVTGTLDFDIERHWALRDLTVSGDAATLTADAIVLSADAATLEGDYRLTLPELARLSATLGTPVAGKLEASGTIGGSLERPTLVAELSSSDLSVDETPLGAARARLSVTNFSQPLSGDVDLSVDPAGVGVVTVASGFSLRADDTLHLEPLTVASRDTRLAGSMAINLDNATATGTLAGVALPLASWSDVAGRALSGQANVGLDLSSRGQAQQLDLTVKASALNVELKPGQTLSVDSVDVSARLEDAFGKASGAMRVLAGDARTSNARFTSTAIELKMEHSRRARGRIQTRGVLSEPFELEIIADYDARERGFLVTLSQVNATLAGRKLVLSKPAHLERNGNAIALSDATFSVAGGRLSARGRVAGEDIEARLELEAIELAALNTLAPMGHVSGTLSGHATVSGTRSAPAGELQLETAGLRSAHATLASAPPVSGRLQGQWRNGRLELNARFAEIAATSLEARASVPLQLEPETLLLHMPEEQSVDGSLRWSGELSSLWDPLSPYEDRFTGPGKLSLELAGTMGSPRLSGFFQVSGGRYENVLSGTTLSAVELRLVGSGDKLVLEKLSASDGKAGTLEGSGSIDILPAQSFPTNLQLDFSDLLLIARDDLILTAGGHLKLEGTLSNALLSGEVITGQSELSLAGTLPPEVVELDVREVNSADPARTGEKNPDGAAEPSIFTLNLDISVPGRAFVRGLGLDSEWKGDVRISGNAHSPNVAGILNPVRGQFSLMGKNFKLERGAIRFTGSNDVDPLLDLTAEHATSGLTAIVRVTGSVSRPKVALSSRPPLPESEIASQVLFGTASNNLSPAQSLQLASAIATYSGTGGAIGILDRTRRALGVDVINFDESEQDPDSTRVSVGKYVTEGVYLEVEGGTDEDSRTTTTVEVEVLPDVRVEGGTTESGGNKVGVKWKWDY
jgi:translocation and assembly module TamB